MPTYLDRYLAGECEQVWDELMALGAAVREQPLYDDALAVARETMRRARYNVETIVARLRESGYNFYVSDRICIPPQPNAEEKVRALEELSGVIPLSMKMWYEIVGEVDLMGTHPQWRVSGYALGTYDHIYRTDVYCKYVLELNKRPIQTEPLQVKGIGRQLTWFNMWQEYDANKLTPYWADKGFSQTPFTLLVSDHQNDRSGFSGGGVDEIALPEPSSIDGVVIHDYGHEPPESFIAYLRRSFQWGGFPGFANVDESLRPTAMLAQLTEGLLPI